MIRNADWARDHGIGYEPPLPAPMVCNPKRQGQYGIMERKGELLLTTYVVAYWEGSQHAARNARVIRSYWFRDEAIEGFEMLKAGASEEAVKDRLHTLRPSAERVDIPRPRSRRDDLLLRHLEPVSVRT